MKHGYAHSHHHFYKLLVFILLSPALLHAGFGNHSATFLQIPSGARQVAMGEAFTGLSYNDINLMS